MFARVLFECCICLTLMLLVFHPNIAYVSHICCKCCIQMLYMFCNGYTRIFLVFQTYVASVSTVSDACCKCFF
jgi:hypothetical protein